MNSDQANYIQFNNHSTPFFTAQGVSSVNIYNSNKEQITNNTTYTLDSPGSDKSCFQQNDWGGFATPPSSASQNILGLPGGFGSVERALAEAQVIQNRKARDDAKKKYTPEQTEQNRKRIQSVRDYQGKLLRDSSDIFRIECTLKGTPVGKASWHMNIDVLLNSGEKFHNYKARLQNTDTKTLMRNVQPKYQDWPGYTRGKLAIREGFYAAKIVMRQTSSLKFAAKFIHKTIVLMEPPKPNQNITVYLLINDQQYILELEPTVAGKTGDIFSHKGVLQLDLETGI